MDPHDHDYALEKLACARMLAAQAHAARHRLAPAAIGASVGRTSASTTEVRAKDTSGIRSREQLGAG